jgi:dTDP-4-dehydrorhamnose reductase
MKVLVLGANGMLGHKLVEVLGKRFDVWATVRKSAESNNFNKQLINDVNAESIEEVRNAILKVNPDVILNAIGVIKQIESSKNVVKALTINSIFPHLVNDIAQEIGAKFITISTDCVFSGEKGNYSENDIPDATDVYGKSKNLGEVVDGNALTIRTSIIGHELRTSHSLLDWFLSNSGGTVKGYKNAIFSGFPTVVLSQIIAEIIEKHQNLRELYHISSDAINKYDLLCLIREFYKADIEIIKDEIFCIDRSLNSQKYRETVGFIPKSWREMIEIMVSDRGKKI